MNNQTFTPGVASIPATLVEISVSCRNLKNKDSLSRSDPLCVLFMKNNLTGSYYEVGRTERIQDSLNPNFVHKFILQYYFEESQKLKFEVYDIDSSSKRLEAHDFLGQIECTLGEIVAFQGRQFTRNLVKCFQCSADFDFKLVSYNLFSFGGHKTSMHSNYGSIILVVDEVGSCKQIATMQFLAKHLDKKDFWGKSDPFLVIYRANEDNSYTVVHKTEVVKNNLNPTWKPFTIPVRALCNGDYQRAIKIECYDWDSDGGHDFIGEFLTNLKTLSEGPGVQNEYECINVKKKMKKKGYKNSGEIRLMQCNIVEEQTFLDYVKGGTQLHFTVAVDFTASNGNPSDPRSLHFIHSSHPNSYALAIQAVGEIIQDYDSDKLFPALGFGAKLPPDGRVSHEFFLNGHPTNPYCQGVEGILDAYGRTLSTVQLYGPTNFSPVINHVASFAAAHQDGCNYFILLIITDGVISDMPCTKESIVRASTLPMSIIIVGVGNADFSAMEELDGDNVRISSNGRYAERDIVQFVAFKEFLSTGSWMHSKVTLAKEVLAEIPTQFLLYMKKRGIKAKPHVEGIPDPTTIDQRHTISSHSDSSTSQPFMEVHATQFTHYAQSSKSPAQQYDFSGPQTSQCPPQSAPNFSGPQASPYPLQSSPNFSGAQASPYTPQSAPNISGSQVYPYPPQSAPNFTNSQSRFLSNSMVPPPLFDNTATPNAPPM